MIAEQALQLYKTQTIQVYIKLFQNFSILRIQIPPVADQAQDNYGLDLKKQYPINQFEALNQVVQPSKKYESSVESDYKNEKSNSQIQLEVYKFISKLENWKEANFSLSN
ncbi:hypothetical protein TTHERM_000346669 (macronuclear) [Tetrahymena thermophila SB210]|uniref:Uncharacterized protein n=1 Tax=Tetrahymena thermophila (strain SB210) TaxID=312017 RepID=W7X3F0_TETTS|nr:hypothetical protein TTHERM_000346669 [Tetrahymena thermophila SB210]EWS73805.1 hypothetical protein TTHERM_000346669 [Tetrahymena thermophila SB210]|eukprot:XP_012653685.1 hypothetical protein TTHERM_000346669 [Tetrahymena thermophila SB210]